MTKTQKHKLLFLLIATFVFALVLIAFVNSGRFKSLNLQSSNFLYLQENDIALDDIVLVAIDDQALELRSASEIGTLQFAKSDYAKLLEALENGGAAAIGLDVILSEPSPDEDQQALVDILKRYNNIVLAAQSSDDGESLKPLQSFIDASPESIASVLYTPDLDNTVRRQKIKYGDAIANYSLAYEVVSAYLGQEISDRSPDQGFIVLSDDIVRVGQNKVRPITIPVNDRGEMLINFFGRPGSFPTISMATAIEGEFLDTKTGELIDLQDKIILIGEIGTALHDVQTVPTSFGVLMPGVEIHANAIQTILTQSFLTEQSESSLITWSILIFLISLILFLVFRIRWSVLILIILLAGYTILTWVSFAYGDILNVIYPYLAILLSFTSAYIYRYFAEERKARDTKRSFGKYVSPHIVQEIIENPQKLALGGEKKNITVFFSDIAGFTSISEKLGAEELVEQLNEYLDAMSEVILEQDGTIDKYIGDAIMAFWNAPIKQEDHAWRACKASLEYQKRLSEMNKERVAKGEMAFTARIGLNTGDMIVGNMGSTKRFDYTVIGDPVNLGARLEGVNKVYGTDIMISEYTYAQAKDDIEVRELDLITVKGKEVPVRIYELQAMKGEGTDDQKKIRDIFASGLAAYREKKWDEAIGYFKQVLSIDETDGPSTLFIDRCNQLKDDDLPGDWDGVYRLKTK